MGIMTIDDTLRRDLFKSKAKSGDRERSGTSAYDIDLDKHLVSSSKQVLLKHVDFHPAQKDISFRLQNLRGKYVPLNPSKLNSPGEGTGKSQRQLHKDKMSGQQESPGSSRSDGIPPPKQVLCSPDSVRLDWHKCYRVGSGLINMGNTCFLNSTLQCLTYTAPLANYLLSQRHKEECRAYGFCIMCDLYTHIQRSFQHHGQAIRPMNMIHKLKSIAKHMHIGRQEDAHEFLRYVIEAMQKACLSGFDKLDRYSKETSPVYQIFGGYYRSRVICATCQSKSDTYDPFLDISLDIKHAPSVTKALQRLIQPETLDGDNAYQCRRCNRKVQAQKRFTIHRCPNILTLCLKRFEYNRFSMGKINKEVNFSEFLNLRPYMSESKGPAVIFQLYALLKHEGASCNSGHYYCYVRAPNQSWYCMNDSYVSQSSLNRVLNQNAYVLFYIKRPKNNVNGSTQMSAQQTNKQMPKTVTSPNLLHSKSSNPHQGPSGTPVSRPKPTPPRPTPPTPHTSHAPLTSKPKMIPADPPEKKKPQAPTTVPPAAKHNLPQMIPPHGKVSFVIKHKGVGSVLQTLQKGQQGGVDAKAKVKTSPVAAATAVKAKDVSTPGAKRTDPVKDSGKFQKNRSGVDVLKQVQVQEVPVKTWESLSSPSPGNGRVKKVAAAAAAAQKNNKRSSLVPYDDDDDSSASSDSENYDAVVERISKVPLKDMGASSSTVCKESSGDSDMKPPDAKAGDANGKRSALASSTNLTAIRKTDSPLKLTITTNGNAQRLMSTKPWRVTDSDQQVSPSVNSDSSNHSNQSSNSTSEWAVNDKSSTPSMEELIKKEASHVGWNVKPSPSRNSTGKFRHESGEEARNSTPIKHGMLKGQKEVGMGNGVKHKTSPFSGKEEKSYQIKREKLGIVPKSLNGKHNDQGRTKAGTCGSQGDAQSATGAVKEGDKTIGKPCAAQQQSGASKVGPDEARSNGKKNGLGAKKNGKSAQVEGSLQKRLQGSSSSSCDDSEVGEQAATQEGSEKFKKKRKKKRMQGHDTDEPKDNNTDGQREKEKHKVEGAGDIGKSEKLPEGDAFRKYRGRGNDSDSDHSSDAPFKLKKKKRPLLPGPHFPPTGIAAAGQRGYPETFRSPPGSDYEEDFSPVIMPPQHGPWRKGGFPSVGGYHEDRGFPQQSQGNNTNAQWYSPPLGKKQKMMNGYEGNWDKQRFRQEGYMQHWDQHIREGGYPRPPGPGPHKLSHSWDGTRRGPSGEVMDYLNNSSLKGYGASVQSWDGGRSGVDEEVARDGSMMKRRNSWDDQYDRGKTKRVRNNNYRHFDRHGHHNPFQHHQNLRNKGSFRGHPGKFSQYHMKKSRSWPGHR